MNLLQLLLVFLLALPTTGQAQPCAYVSTEHECGISIVDLGTKSVLRFLPFTDGCVFDIAVSPDARFAYLARNETREDASDGAVSVLNLSTGSVSSIFVGGGARRLTLNPDARTLYVTTEDSVTDTSRVVIIDTTTNTVRRAIPLPPDAVGDTKAIAVSAHSSLVYVGTELGLVLISASTDEIVGDIRLFQPHRDAIRALALSPDEAFVYAAGDDTLWVIRTDRNEVVTTLPVGRPWPIAFAPDGASVFTAGGGNYENSEIRILDTHLYTAIGTIPLEFEPDDAAFSADGKTAYVTGTIQSQSQSGVLAVIDTTTRTINGTIQLSGLFPRIQITAAPCLGAAPACRGDCSADGEVTIDELLTLVNIALGTTNLTSCTAGDANHDAQITIDEILSAVNAALNQCTG